MTSIISVTQYPSDQWAWASLNKATLPDQKPTEGWSTLWIKLIATQEEWR